MALTPDQILLYWLTILIIAVKFCLIGFLSIKLYRRNKQQKLGITDFFVGILILLLTLAISRLIYFYFDFYLTELNPLRYLTGSNLTYWRIASVISGLGQGYLLIVVDRRILNNKFKGLLGYFVIAIAILHIFYPVYNLNDFTILSTIGMVTGVTVLLIPLIFIWLGLKTPSNRKIAFLIALGAILYAVSGFLWGESILHIFGSDIRTIITIFSAIMRIAGLTIISVSASKLQI